MCNLKNFYVIKILINNFCFRGNLTTRIVWSIIIEVMIFVGTVVLAMLDSSEWPDIFFWVTIGSVIALNSKFKLC